MGDEAEILYFMEDLKASTGDIQKAETVHDIVKRYGSSVGMVVNRKKSAIQLNVEKTHPRVSPRHTEAG